MAVGEIILFVTNRCNLNCFFCCNADIHKTGEELSLEDYRAIAKTLSKPLYRLLISGGEPTLRDDLPEIIETFYKINGVRKFNIPLNGFESEKTLAIVKDIFKRCPECIMTLNMSLDSFEELHNKMRGNPSAFKRIVETLDLLLDYKKKRGKREKGSLILRINSLITQINIERLPEFSSWVKKRFPGIDDHPIEICRELDTKNVRRRIGLTPEQIRRLGREKLKNVVYYFRKHNFIYTTHIYILSMIEVDMAIRNPGTQRTYFRCMAYRFNRVIYPNGDVSICETLPPFGNLNDFNFDFEKFENYYKVYDKRLTCSCMHTCFIAPSLRRYPLNIINYFLDILWSRLKQRKVKI